MKSGVYIHIPFCKSRCSYCDFATDVYRGRAAVDRYVNALVKEISDPNSEFPNPTSQIETLYFGGGTPSLLSPRQLESIVSAVSDRFALADDLELTLEMNPATVTPEKLRAYRSIGVNRASFGVQTFNNRDLKLLARGHDATDARLTYIHLREAGFENVSFDLIAGLPGQSIDDWQTNLEEAVALAPEHLSLYLLEIHEGTPLAAQLRSQRRPVPNEDVAAEMYELMLEMTASAGLDQYEISNFARSGFESRHNSKYWTLDPVFGFGVSAHSFDGRERYSNERDTNLYVNAIESGASAVVAREPAELRSEFVFLGLRMMRGVDFAEYERRFGEDLRVRNGEGIDRLSSLGLIVADERRMKLTRRGALLSNEVFAEFL
ncbi:MAG TPA: radical SAM family heme chaperone HemW [Pyrinomonadaceae bacterium]|nr:radical SAM family heme chaperone HemW [Pyrinomonadaceae bacterium]